MEGKERQRCLWNVQERTGKRQRVAMGEGGMVAWGPHSVTRKTELPQSLGKASGSSHAPQSPGAGQAEAPHVPLT